ncbi:MAG: hypothetical protein R3C32_03190 [Chloroflexota bacterium]
MFQPFDGEGDRRGPRISMPHRGLVRDGRMLVVDPGHGRVRRVEADGTLITVVGGDGQGVTGSAPAVRPHSRPNSVIAGPLASCS